MHMHMHMHMHTTNVNGETSTDLSKPAPTSRSYTVFCMLITHDMVCTMEHINGMHTAIH